MKNKLSKNVTITRKGKLWLCVYKDRYTRVRDQLSYKLPLCIFNPLGCFDTTRLTTIQISVTKP